MLSGRDLTFAQFQVRLLEEARRRIHNGEFTERGLARLAGISQPHLHNLLKGVRDLTTASADSLLVAIDRGVLDLAHLEELGLAIESLRAGGANTRLVPVLQGRIGPGWPIPDPRQAQSWRTLPAGISSSGRRPAIALLEPDALVSQAFSGATEAVIDFDEMARIKPADGQWYVLRYQGAGMIRQIRLEPGRIEILGQLDFCGGTPMSLEIGASSVLHLIRARLVWAGNRLEWPIPELTAL